MLKSYLSYKKSCNTRRIQRCKTDLQMANGKNVYTFEVVKKNNVRT